MSTSNPKDPPVQIPSMEDLQAIATAAEEAAARAETAAQAATGASTAADQTARDRGLELPPEVLKQISDMASAATVEKLRAEFELGNPPADLPPGADPVAAVPPVESPVVVPRARRTLAQWFAGE